MTGHNESHATAISTPVLDADAAQWQAWKAAQAALAEARTDIVVEACILVKAGGDGSELAAAVERYERARDVAGKTRCLP